MKVLINNFLDKIVCGPTQPEMWLVSICSTSNVVMTLRYALTTNGVCISFQCSSSFWSKRILFNHILLFISSGKVGPLSNNRRDQLS